MDSRGLWHGNKAAMDVAGKTVYKGMGFMQSVVSGCGYIGVYGFCQKPLR